MFERFTTNARGAVTAAQYEAARLNHNYIGTEHLLLGLVATPESTAQKVLDSLGLSLDKAREQVLERVGTGAEPVGGHIPFTPTSKKVLEFSLREALQLGHNYIGTEHLLLALIREHERDNGSLLAGEILETLDTGLEGIRSAVQEMLGPPSEASQPPQSKPLERQLAEIERSLHSIIKAFEEIRRQN